MSSPQVLITDYAWPSLDVERSILEPLGAKLLVAERGDQDELLHLAPQANAILTCWRQIPVAVLAAASPAALGLSVLFLVAGFVGMRLRRGESVPLPAAVAFYGGAVGVAVVQQLAIGS